MKSISILQTELNSVREGRWDGQVDPFARPRIGLNADMEAIGDYDRGRLVIECEESVNYPEYLGAELLEPLDRLVGCGRGFPGEASGVGELQEGGPLGHGLDALAWYVSFHTFAEPWGVFIPVSSLIYLEQRAFNVCQINRAQKLEVGFNLLLEHELFHFAVDYVCAHWEIVMKAPCWSSLAYKRVHGKIGYLGLEEALANAYMLRTLEPGWGKAVANAVRKFVCSQPAGYRDAEDYVATSEFNLGLAELVKLYIGLHSLECGVDVRAFDHHALFPVQPIVPRGYCPIHVIHDLAGFNVPPVSLRFYPRPRNIVETSDFKKMLSRAPQDILKRWNRKKAMVQQMGFPGAPEFEKFRGFFSLRVGDNFRAHLRHLKGEEYDWEAFEIGPHTKMGHG